MTPVSEIKLIRTDTTLDLSQKAEKVWKKNLVSPPRKPRARRTSANGSREELIGKVRGRRQAHNPTLAKIMRLAYDRSHSHNRPHTAACNAVYSISRRALLITRLGEQLPRSMLTGSGTNAETAWLN